MSKNFLSEILEQKRKVLARNQRDSSTIGLSDHALETRRTAVPHRLLQALQSESPSLKIIAEFKRRSPSAGTIRANLSADEVARRYERGGACAISVLTDEAHFGGSIADLRVVRSTTNLPILRKDFIVDPIQIYEAAIAGADAVLLIGAALDDDLLCQLRQVAEDELGLDALIEVHTSNELRRALNAGANIIGVNNRDLQSFQVSLETSERLIAEAPHDKIMISESGLQSAQSLRRLNELGFDGFLIGETLMRASDTEKALRDLIGSTHFRRASTIQIKICGITNARDAKACIDLGAQMIGLNFYPESPRYIQPEVARQIVETLPTDTRAVGVFVDGNADAIRKTANTAGLQSVQLHGNLSPDTVRELAGEFRVIRAFATHTHFRPEDVSLFPNCDALIDAHHPGLRGGTGQTCNWEEARGALAFARFLILSGGLNARNVGVAIKAVMPHAVDVCSGVESAPGVKDHRVMEQFVAAVRKAQGPLEASFRE
jgi:indole-3-glycerol phosphate synthase/phosphoribosylanthranilate isomerase/anthranilate synthase/indole-3-glycerol phosphate synthase/phosphoribosylanthranilate isomerase